MLPTSIFPNKIVEISCRTDENGDFINAEMDYISDYDLVSIAQRIHCTAIWALSEPDENKTSYYSPYGVLHVRTTLKH